MMVAKLVKTKFQHTRIMNILGVLVYYLYGDGYLKLPPAFLNLNTEETIDAFDIGEMIWSSRKIVPEHEEELQISMTDGITLHLLPCNTPTPTDQSLWHLWITCVPEPSAESKATELDGDLVALGFKVLSEAPY